ncbi:MAG: ABC transporter [Candidatus Electrothrix sp. EH2]|nr:ABC transporter [Candidatus Electrothrix sp. EH2]
MLRFFSQKSRIVMALLQPLIWLIFMGNVMSGMTRNPYGAALLGVDRYLDFMTPGIIIMTALFSGTFSGFSLVWDRRIGFLNRMLAAPLSRSAIPAGKMTAICLQVMFQACLIGLIALALGVRFAAGLSGFLLIALIAGLFGAAMAGVSLSIAVLFKSFDALHPLLNFLTMPLMFTSNAIFPTAAMPGWMQVIADWNPLSHAVSPIRTLTVEGWAFGSAAQGLAVTMLFAGLMLIIATVQFKRSIE